MPRQLLSPESVIMGKRDGKRGEEKGYLRGRQIARNPRAARKIDASDTISLLYTVRWINHSPRLPSSRRSARRGSTSSYFPCFHSQISSTSIHVPVIPPRNGSASEELIPSPCLAPFMPLRPPSRRYISSYTLVRTYLRFLVDFRWLIAASTRADEELPVIKC